MNALSIRQPWAWLILHAGKDIENRDWYTDYRGPLLIHAGKTMTRLDYADAMDFAIRITDKPLPAFADIPRGAIVGRVDLLGTVTKADDTISAWYQGRYGWVFANPRACDPLPYRGQLGLFSVPGDTIIKLHYPEGEGVMA